eukprot:COSAG06_NODE_51295_length_313_cov_0.719626_1_plen_36_part_01
MIVRRVLLVPHCLLCVLRIVSLAGKLPQGFVSSYDV